MPTSKEEMLRDKISDILHDKIEWGMDRVYGRDEATNDMCDLVREENIAFAEWLIDTYTTDEGRLPLSGNTTLGGRTIFINGNEYPFSHTYTLFINRKIK